MSKPKRQVSPTEKQSLQWLEQNSRLSPGARKALASLVPHLAERLNQASVNTLAIAGPPGSGKTTLAGMLAHVLNESGRATTLLSLDDYYLPLAHRMQLADGQHPLLARRGVPGTHDWVRFLDDIDLLKEGRIENLRLPVFNKSTDDVQPMDVWRQVDIAPGLLIIEGWCIGAPPQDESSLQPAINPMEQEMDPDGSWRHFVNQRIAACRADLLQRVDHFWYLSAPDWPCVIDWRWQQEQELTHPHLKSREEVEAFLATFERTVKHMRLTCSEWADSLLACDRSHQTVIIR